MYNLVMACRGVHFAITKIDVDRLLTAPDDYAVARIDQDWLRSRYDAIDPDAYGLPKSEENWAYTWQNFAGLVSFFQKAATAERYMLFTVDR